MKKILFVLCILFACVASAQRDTTFTFKVTVPVEIQYKERLVYVTSDTARLSAYASLSEAVIDAIKKRVPLLVDKSVTVSKTILLDTSISIFGRSGVVITNNAPSLFLFRSGDFSFNNLTIVGAGTFLQGDYNNSIWHVWRVAINSCTVRGAYNGFNNSRGGDGCVVTVRNSFFSTRWNSLVAYNQNGSKQEVYSENSYYQTDTSHCWYIHPNVSISSNGDSLFAVGRGVSSLTALGVHHYSGGGVPGKAGFVRYKNTYSNRQIELCNNDGKFVKPSDGVVIDSCDMPLYHSVIPELTVRNSSMSFAFMQKSRVINCTGRIYPGDSTYIIGGNYPQEIDLQQGGFVQLENIKAAAILPSKATVKPINLVIINSKVEQWSLPLDAKVKLVNTEVPKGLWGFKLTTQDVQKVSN